MPQLPWEKLNEIFHAALELPSSERGSYLDNACGTDKDLRNAVDSLLRSHEATHNFVDTPAYEATADLLRADRQLKPGHAIHHYRILSLLGEGGMGMVYLAEDRKLHRKVSLKLLPLEATRDYERLHRFELEARASSALNHPNVLTVHEIGEDAGRHFIATEFVDGETLRERLESPIEIDEVVRIAIDVASALVATHRVHIVHRDIKPENIMIRRDDGLVKVLDFGLAKMSVPHQLSSDDLERKTLPNVNTAPGVVMGTLQYMSPEQARGDNVDERTDVWSLGVVLFEMIAGCKPFAGGTANDTIAAIVSRTPALPLSHYCQTVPERLQEIVAKALTKDREERYQTSKDLLIDLKRFQRSLESGDEQTKPVSSVSVDDHRKSARYRNGIIATALLLIFGAALLYFWRDRLGIGTGSQSINSIAVLPLFYADSDSDAEFLSNGITENIIGRLSQLPGLKVMAHSAVNHYKGKSIDARTIGKDLSVEVLLTGRLVKRSDTININLELVDTTDNSRIWGERYERKLSDLPTVQKEIPLDVSNKLRLRLSGEARERLGRTDTINSEAFQLYLKGRLSWETWSHEGARQAVAFFEEAIKKDSTYALAWSGIADAYLVGAGVGPQVTTKEAQRRAREAATEAIRLDPQLGEARVALAGVLVHADWDFAEAEREYKYGLTLNPNFAEGHHLYSHLLMALGRMEEAFVESRKFIDLDPLSRTPREHLALNYLLAGQYDQAIEKMQKVVEQFPKGEPDNYFVLGDAYFEKQRYSDALESYLKGLAETGFSEKDRAKFRKAFEDSGIKGFYRALLNHFKAVPQSRVHFSLAELHARLGEKDAAFELLEKAYAERSSVGFIMKETPGFNDLKSDPRYADLLKRIGLPQ